MLKEYTFWGSIILEFTQKRLLSNKIKTIKREFDYCDIIYAKDLESAKEKRDKAIEKFVKAEYPEPVKWNGLLKTGMRVQGCLGTADARRVLKVEPIEYKEVNMYSKDISNWTINKCKNYMTPQEYKEHCEE